MLSLDAAWRDLVLLEPDMLDFVDSQWEALTSLKSQLWGGGGEWQEVGKEPEEGREGELGLVCKIKNN